MFKFNRKQFFFSVCLILILWFLFSLPNPLFNLPKSTIVEDYKGNLLSAKIADDGQWRFPTTSKIPKKFEQALLCYEDEYFYFHPGVNPVSLFRALRQNIRQHKIVSGGSTITMQTIRIARQNKQRTIWEKMIEIFLSLRLELTNSKKNILSLYASNAPFGGNVVGLDAASWRYFGRSPDKLSWGEVATLAVLPNAPSLIFPGKNHEQLLKKRNTLLNKLLTKKIIDKQTCELSKDEPLPNKPFDLPTTTPHLLDRLIKDGNKGKRITTTIDIALQEKLNLLVDDFHSVYKQNEIHNIGVVVVDNATAKVLAYVGNTNCNDNRTGKDVDVVVAPRSTGSILKPFLYTFMLQDGAMLPNSIVSDIPTVIGGYSPKNFDETYMGIVPAGEALARSLNVPHVRLLQEYGLEKFYDELQDLHLSTLNKPASHYGLSLILGGAEATLWDLTNVYRRMAETLSGSKVFTSAGYIEAVNNNEVENNKTQQADFKKSALWWTMEAMSSLTRPVQESGWQEFQSSVKIAWKTGTSFGHRDAWSIGVMPKYTVGVWIGNADGEGRPDITGVEIAAPVMFKIFKLLPSNSEWFTMPTKEMISLKVCKQSGFRASAICPETEFLLLPKNSINAPVCKYHQIIHLDKSQQYRVNSDCYSVYDMQNLAWFVINPVEEYYYKQRNPQFKPLPPYLSNCEQSIIRNMAIIYPKNYTKVFIPRELSGKQGKVVFEVAHRDGNATLFWHLDNNYIGKTINTHTMEINTNQGLHRMTIVDDKGETISWNFEVLEK